MGEDSSVPPLSQLYRGPYKVVDRKDKYFKLQIGSKLDNVSVNRLKPVFSDEKVSSALPLPCGRSHRRPPPPVSNPQPPASNPLPPVRRTNISVRFSLSPCQNPPQAALLPISTLLLNPLLGGGGEFCSRQNFYDDIYSVPVYPQTKDVSVRS